MSGFKTPRHGRDHRPGGWDPIPFPTEAWASLALDTDTATDGSSYPGWLEDGFYTSDANVFSFDDGAATLDNAAGIAIAKSGLYLPFTAVPLGALTGDFSADSVHIEQVFVDGGSVSDFLGLSFGIYDQYGILTSGSTNWDPHLLAPLNLRPGHVPATLTFTITQHTGSSITSYPRLFIARLAEAIDVNTTIPTP